VTMDCVRIGVLGIGRWAKDVHIPNLQKLPNTRIAAICSRSAENRRIGAEICLEKPLLFEKPEDMFNCPDIDAVVLTTPNCEHAGQSIQALKAGKHVLTEKPMALRIENAREVIEAVGTRVLLVGFELRYCDVASAARAAIDAGKIGKPRLIIQRMWRNWGGSWRTWRGDPAMSGGIFAEILCHSTDLQSYLAGSEPVSVFAGGGRTPISEQPNFTNCAIQYANGIQGTIQMCLFMAGAENEYPFEVIGEEGRLSGEILSGRLLLWSGRDAKPEDISMKRGPYSKKGYPGSEELAVDFVSCILNGGTPRSNARGGLAATALTLAIEESLASGAPVKTGL